MFDKEVRNKLNQDLDETFWKDIHSHISRDAVVVISNELDIIDVAMAIYFDKKDEIKSLIDKGKVFKPSIEKITKWQKEEERIQCLVVYPFVVVQKIS